jgi:hypothetical protein
MECNEWLSEWLLVLFSEHWRLGKVEFNISSPEQYF